LKKSTPKTLSASVHQRLLNIARDTGTPFNEILQYFAMERMLHRLSCSSYADSFVLKGALLFRVWDVPDSRATRDIDLLAYVDNSAESLASIFRDVVAIDKSDGLVFDPDSVAAQTIKEDADYEGVRVRFRGLLGKARITMQIDVGFGDKVHSDVAHGVPAAPGTTRETNTEDYDQERHTVFDRVSGRPEAANRDTSIS
jgi:hypothetical protein